MFSARIFRLVPVSLFITRWFSPRQLPSSLVNLGSCMIALSWVDSLRSISAMARSKVRLRFLSNVTVPASASSTRVFTRSWARSGSVCLVAATTWSRKLRPSVVSAAAPAAPVWACDMISALLLVEAKLARQRLHLGVVLQHLFEQALELRGAVHLAHEVAQLVAGLQQRLQCGHLLGHLGRLEIVHRVELQVHGHLAAVI